jgi:predicted ribosome quality control (RQC) complex YloA/Tae2 family protein
MVAVVDGRVKKNNVSAFFGSGYFILHGGKTIDSQRDKVRDR